MPQFDGNETQRTWFSASLQKKISLYALAAGAAGVELLASALPAESEVLYTPVHQIIGQNQILSIDLNQDGVTDFIIQSAYSRTGGPFKDARLVVGAEAGGAVLYSNSRFSAAALRGGVQIGPRSPFQAGRLIMANRIAQSFAGTSYYWGYWFNVSNSYVGLRFMIDGQLHYGWARFSTRSSAKFKMVAALTGYAYETDPNTPIKAGTTGSISAAGATRTDDVSRRPAPTTLAALALGAPGLAIWRREEET